MKITLLLPSNNIYANFMAKEIIRRLNGEIAMVVESDLLIPRQSIYSGLKKYIGESGFRYFSAQVSKHVLFYTGQFVTSCLAINKGDKSFFSPYKNIAGKFHIPVIKTGDINDPRTITAIKATCPGLIISLYFRQVLGRDILSLPARGCLNVHPSLLPRYRGVSPIFWALAEGAADIGVTIHFMNEKIDEGNIIAQISVPVKEQDDEHALFLKCSVIALRLLLKKIEEIKSGLPVPEVRQAKSGSYFSLPTKRAVGEFRKIGHSFFTIRDFLSSGKTVSDLYDVEKEI